MIICLQIWIPNSLNLNKLVILKFKDVGQGDSILLIWEENGRKKIGIIDCHRYENTNPILDEVSAIKGDYDIVFIIISHGHQDHYSGVKELLIYCRKSNITIEHFISTLHPTQFEFLKSTASRSERKSITELITMVNLLDEDEIITDMYPAFNRIIRFELEDFLLECLYPRQANYTALGSKLNKYLKGQIKTQPDLNYISTIFKLSNKSLYALLTSDCLKESLDTIEKKDQDIRNKELHLAQVPHHGSINNHNEQFWKNRKRVVNCPAVISSGESTHNLPNEEVVRSFTDLGYKIYSTNYVNGIKSYVESENTAKDYSFMINHFSDAGDEYTIKKSDRFRGDKVFHLEENKITYIPQN